MSKYDPISEYLRLHKEPVWHATFGEIERVLGFRLPQSARKYQAWWANEAKPTTHVQKLSWMRAGWYVESVDMLRKSVLFRREGSAWEESPPRIGVRRSDTPTIPDVGRAVNDVPAWEVPFAVSCSVQLEWKPVGQVMLDLEKRLRFPHVSAQPGLYRFRVLDTDGERVYIGESENIAQRFTNYRNPGSSQPTNIRINELFRNALKAGAEIGVTIVTSGAVIDIGQGEQKADLSQKMIRLLLENTSLVSSTSSDITLLNR